MKEAKKEILDKKMKDEEFAAELHKGTPK